MFFQEELSISQDCKGSIVGDHLRIRIVERQKTFPQRLVEGFHILSVSRNIKGAKASGRKAYTP